MPAIAPAELLFFGDLNCPFCYVENERLEALRVADTLQWRGVEHAPNLPLSWSDGSDALEHELDQEMAALAERAPEVPVKRPKHRPNSHLGLLTIAAALRSQPESAPALRSALFRALWRDSRDISQAGVVSEVCQEVGLDGLEVTRSDRGHVKVCGVEWANGGFDRRIPVIATAEGSRLLGLAKSDAIATFLADSRAGGHGKDVCR